ncbi:hypothetical protein [Sphingobacterium faecium]
MVFIKDKTAFEFERIKKGAIGGYEDLASLTSKRRKVKEKDGHGF